ncbi:hypothetical protein C8R47DRAFT_988069, partial [Mycena vitilis]
HPPIEQLTAQNHDLTFGTNVLGHFYFTRLLIPTLLDTATPGNPVRVVNTSSIASELFGGVGINYNTLRDSPARKKAGPNTLYYQSKFVLPNELWRRYGEQGVVSVACNPPRPPRWVHKMGSRTTTFARLLTLKESTLYPTPYGALTQLWAGTTDAGASFDGKYLIPCARIGANPSTNAASEKALWTWLEEQVENI